MMPWPLLAIAIPLALLVIGIMRGRARRVREEREMADLIAVHGSVEKVARAIERRMTYYEERQDQAYEFLLNQARGVG